MTSAELTVQAVEEIRKTEARRVEALLKGDIDVLDQILSEDHTYGHANGRVDTKAQYLESIRSGRTKYLAAEYHDVDIRVYDAAGVVTGRAQLKLNAQDREVDLLLRFTMVYMRLDGRWQAVAWQAARLEG